MKTKTMLHILLGLTVAATPCLAKVRSRTATPGRPTYLDDVERNTRRPASNLPPRSVTTEPQPTSTQLSFYEVTPSLGSISIKGRSAFTLGSDLSFRLSQSSPFFFEPSVFISFLSGDANTANATLFHLDGGIRYDFIIPNSALVPFLKFAAGPTISTSSNTYVLGNKVSDSYINMFAGGGAKVLINPNVAARADVGVTLQGTDTGLYAMAAVALPL